MCLREGDILSLYHEGETEITGGFTENFESALINGEETRKKRKVGSGRFPNV